MAVRPVMRILRRAAPTSSLVILAAQLGSGVATAGLLLLTTDILSSLLATVPNADRLRAALPALAMLAAVYVVKMILDAAVLHARAHLVPKVRRLAEEELFHASLGVELAAFDDPGFYDQLHRARDRGVMHLEGATACLVDALSAAFAVAGAAAALLLLHPLLLVLLVLALLPEGWAALHAARLQYGGMPLTIAYTRRAQMMGELATQREAAPEIRANQAQEYVLSEFRRCAGELQDHLVRLGIAEARATTSGRLLSGAGLVGTFVALGWMLHQQWLDLAVAGTAVIAIRATSGSLRMFMQMVHELFEKGLYISDYREFTENSAALSRPRRGTAAPASPGRIALENVGFRYPGEHGRTALRDLTLTIEAGQTVALVGENGSGKTTLAKLLAGLYRPGSGRICWDGVDIREMDPESLADRVVMVQQHPIRWPRSAEDNIRLGRYARTDPEEAALMEAARQARATEVVETLPDGWRTLLSREFRGGQDLSAGQWQRLAVARGLYRDAPLVIWDEPTAPLDARAEHAVYESLRGLSRDRTVVMITHRLASVRNADRIFFLERGALVEQGTHRELLAMDGRYAELYRLQMRMHGPEPVGEP
ncbi:ABC transporter ATP-binding protein [Luteimonas sp. SJ-92]|uniref:ABC transporter ATP-binding protein n=1 Tax=Luteimonas salinisoli TaxID=2752307 RepID=A0A853JFT2_9GAMM|nr:ABC transporter ATP-binding protein [Luteimonas salinisoli]NZA28243.1 ABC transporter ATP-binding protein [Luteimonas salinisoli]